MLHFLVDIGDVCNDRMGRPYRKCIALFDTARADCSRLLGDFNFLCDIVEGFRPLCGLARGWLIQMMPSETQTQTHTHSHTHPAALKHPRLPEHTCWASRWDYLQSSSP